MPLIPKDSTNDKAEKRREELLAIPVKELDRLSPQQRIRLLSGKLDITKIHTVGLDRVEKVPAVAFSCNLLTAALICDVLRSDDRKAGDPETNVYIFKSKTWTMLPRNAVLTESIDGETRLNPSIFNVEIMVASPVAPAVTQMKIKRLGTK